MINSNTLFLLLLVCLCLYGCGIDNKSSVKQRAVIPGHLMYGKIFDPNLTDNKQLSKNLGLSTKTLYRIENVHHNDDNTIKVGFRSVIKGVNNQFCPCQLEEKDISLTQYLNLSYTKKDHYESGFMTFGYNEAVFYYNKSEWKKGTIKGFKSENGQLRYRIKDSSEYYDKKYFNKNIIYSFFTGIKLDAGVVVGIDIFPELKLTLIDNELKIVELSSREILKQAYLMNQKCLMNYIPIKLPDSNFLSYSLPISDCTLQWGKVFDTDISDYNLNLAQRIGLELGQYLIRYAKVKDDNQTIDVGFMYYPDDDNMSYSQIMKSFDINDKPHFIDSLSENDIPSFYSIFEEVLFKPNENLNKWQKGQVRGFHEINIIIENKENGPSMKYIIKGTDDKVYKVNPLQLKKIIYHNKYHIGAKTKMGRIINIKEPNSSQKNYKCLLEEENGFASPEIDINVIPIEEENGFASPEIDINVIPIKKSKSSPLNYFLRMYENTNNIIQFYEACLQNYYSSTLYNYLLPEVELGCNQWEFDKDKYDTFIRLKNYIFTIIYDLSKIFVKDFLKLKNQENYPTFKETKLYMPNFYKCFEVYLPYIEGFYNTTYISNLLLKEQLNDKNEINILENCTIEIFNDNNYYNKKESYYLTQIVYSQNEDKDTWSFKGLRRYYLDELKQTFKNEEVSVLIDSYLNINKILNKYAFFINGREILQITQQILENKNLINTNWGRFICNQTLSIFISHMSHDMEIYHKIHKNLVKEYKWLRDKYFESDDNKQVYERLNYYNGEYNLIKKKISNYNNNISSKSTSIIHYWVRESGLMWICDLDKIIYDYVDFILLPKS